MFFHPKGPRFSGWPAEDQAPHRAMMNWIFAKTREDKRRFAREYQEYIAKNMYWVNLTSAPYFEVATDALKDYYFTNGLQMWLHKAWLDR